MRDEQQFGYKTADGDTRVQIGSHRDIDTPFYAPEIKNWQNDLHVTLDYLDVLEPHNPVLVPACDWVRLREKKNIIQRTTDDGETVGAKEVANLEAEHPLIHFFPPELFAFRGKTDLLSTYLLKRDKQAKTKFRKALRNGHIDTALDELPDFARPFIRSNLNPVLTNLNIERNDISSSEMEFSEIWKSMSSSNFERFHNQIADDAMALPSAVVVTPVPLFSQYDDELVTALCTANSTMADAAKLDNEPRAFFHLYLHYMAFTDGQAGDMDTAAKMLQVLKNEVNQGDFAGIAVTIYRGKKALESSTVPCIGTFFDNLSTIAADHNLPVICPRSQWLGLWATDFGIEGFSSLYNGSWVYRSGGPVSDVDRYGYTMVRGESRALKLRSKDGADIEDKLSNGGLSTMEGLPEEPPDPPADFTPQNQLQAEYGTSFFSRRRFGKPQRLNHIWEVKHIRSKNEPAPAREYLEESENEYMEFEEE